MPIISRRSLLTSGAAFAASLAAPSAFAQNWPQKPVRVLVGFAAGGNIDNLARVTCARLSEVFGQQFVVENRVGAMGTLAAARRRARERRRSHLLLGRHRHGLDLPGARQAAVLDEGSRAGQPDRHQPAGAHRQRQAADQDAAGIRRLGEAEAEETRLRRRRRSRQRQQSVDGAVPQARGTWR